jgi:putative acetyltransferase
LALSLVAVDNDRVIGHIAASPVSISDGTDGWYGIGPVSVTPEWQGRGIGSQLLRRAVAELQGTGAAGCVLLGDPRCYARFGFRPEAALVLPDVPPEYFQAMSFCAVVPKGRVSYHEAFNAKN